MPSPAVHASTPCLDSKRQNWNNRKGGRKQLQLNQVWNKDFFQWRKNDLVHLQNWTQRYRLSSATALLFNSRHTTYGFPICIFQVWNAVGGGAGISQPLLVLSVGLVFPPAYTTWGLCPWNPTWGAVRTAGDVPVLASATLRRRGEGT